MARDLGDVLHYFLDDDEVAQKPPGGGPPLLTAPAHGEDRLRAALVRELAIAFARRGHSVQLLQPNADPSIPPSASIPGFSLKTPCIAGGLGALHGDIATARDELREQPRPLLLVALPTESRWTRDERELLRQVWLTPRYSDGGRAEFLSLTSRILDLQPEAEIGASVLGVADLGAARRAFASFAELYEARFERRLRSQGLVLDELEVCRTLSADDPGRVVRPGSRAARTLDDVVSLLCEDLEPACDRLDPGRPFPTPPPGPTAGLG